MLGRDSLSTQVELTISCKDLIKLDLLSQSDPKVFIELKNKKTSQWQFIGQTETLKDAKNPTFEKKVKVQYFFEENQELHFRVVDSDSDQDTSKHQLIGDLYCTLGKIVGSRGSCITQPLINKENPSRKNGFISIQAEEISETSHIITLKLSCKNLDKMDIIGKSDPYLVFEKEKNGKFTEVFRTETIMKTLNPNFKSFELDTGKLCSNDFKKSFRVTCFDWDRLSDDELIGYFDITLEKLLKNGKDYRYDVVNPEKKKKNKKYQNSGLLIVDEIKVVKIPTFLDYLVGGQQISLIVAIDFTASNGNPSDPDSLHYMNVNQFNDYQKAIISVGNVLNYYDSDKKYPVFGFGGKVNSQLSHCFPCNFQPSQPEVFGVKGILDIYGYAINQVELFAPTLFSPLLKETNRIAEKYQDNYFVVLILTDGVINDMDATIEQIVKASYLPVSIVIIGIGDADFKNMDMLDSDNETLEVDGKKAERDVVQFVPFSKYKNSSPDSLAEEVLKEIPKQFMNYVGKRNIVPMTRPQVNPFDPNFIQQQQQTQQFDPQIINLQKDEGNVQNFTQ
eukprot:gene2551-3513_t